MGMVDCPRERRQCKDCGKTKYLFKAPIPKCAQIWQMASPNEKKAFRKRNDRLLEPNSPRSEQLSQFQLDQKGIQAG
jgi:hypothetical protein